MTLHSIGKSETKLNGNGFWIQDEITGTMTQKWMLQPPAELNIQSVEQSNFAQSIVEQSASKEGPSTVEIPIRTQNVDVTIISDTSSSKVPRGQWNTDFSNTQFLLWVPSSWMVLYWDGIIWSTLFGALFNVALAVCFAWRFRGTSKLNIPIVFGVGLGGLIAPTSTFVWQCVHWMCVHTKRHHWLFILSVLWGIFALHESQTPPIHNGSQGHVHTSVMNDAPEEDFLYRSERIMTKKDRSFYTQNNTQTIQMGIGLPTWTGIPIQKSWTSQPSTESMTLWSLKDPSQTMDCYSGGHLDCRGRMATNQCSHNWKNGAVFARVWWVLWSPNAAFAQEALECNHAPIN